jgi:hypothetical protein
MLKRRRKYCVGDWNTLEIASSMYGYAWGQEGGTKGIYYAIIMIIKGTVQFVLAREKLPKNNVIFPVCTSPNMVSDAFESSI